MTRRHASWTRTTSMFTNMPSAIDPDETEVEVVGTFTRDGDLDDVEVLVNGRRHDAWTEVMAADEHVRVELAETYHDRLEAEAEDAARDFAVDCDWADWGS